MNKETMAVANEVWYGLSTDAALNRVRSSPSGLTSQEAGLRLAKDGPNELQEALSNSAWSIFAGQFQSLIVWILIGAGVVSGFVGDTIDTVAIFAIVILNAIIGFYQEYTAEQSIAALKKMTAPKAKVLRDGKVSLIPAIQIVVGDVLHFEAGDVVPADARLLTVAMLRCMESALTGESEPVTKSTSVLSGDALSIGDRSNLAFMGTHVVAGTGQAVVVATGPHTELGQIAELLRSSSGSRATPLQIQLDSLGRVLFWATVAIVALLFVLGLLRNAKVFDLFMSTISLAVAAVPEGLPTVVTVALSLGVYRMARRRALIRKLSAVETLGSTSVICTDKTGTLTVGEMTVEAMYVGGQRYDVAGQGYSPEGSISLGAEKIDVHADVALQKLASVLIGCNNSHLAQKKDQWEAIGDPTEAALLAAGIKAGGNQAQLDNDTPRLLEFPFDSDRKRASVLRRMQDGQIRSFTNGAPGRLLQLSTHVYQPDGNIELTQELRDSILHVASDMASQALRVLGSAYRDLEISKPEELDAQSVEKDMVFVGLSGMHDPPRLEVMGALARCRDAGIRVVMITGDHPETAMAIARELKLDTSLAALTGADLDKLSESDLEGRSRDISVYARVTAKNKLRIVRELQKNGAVVAMTGDGVNDAPAIQGADIGIAMGIAGTEVTKQAADMIITDDNFATIVAAIEEGRGIYENIRKTLQYLLSGNSGELLLMAICVIAGLPSPLMPIHLLWINLVTDGLPALCLATDSTHTDAMKRAPRNASEKLTNASFVWTMIATGLLTASVSLLAFLYTLQTSSIEYARSSAFTVLVFSELMRALGARSSTLPMWRMVPLVNLQLGAVIAISIAVQFWSLSSQTLGTVLKTPSTSVQGCLVLFALGCLPMLVLELAKLRGGAKQLAMTIN